MTGYEIWVLCLRGIPKKRGGLAVGCSG